MATNLLTGEPIAEAKEGEGTNLLPALANTMPDPERPEYKPYIKDIGNSFMAGLADTWSNAARTPASMYDLAAMPQNFLVKAIGRKDLQVKSPEWLMDNPVAEYYASQAEAFDVEISPQKTFEEAMETGNWEGMGRSLSLSVIRNAPTQIGLIASYLAGYPGTGLAGMGVLTMADSLKEGRDKGVDPAINAYNSLCKASIEVGMENVGTMGILRTWSKTLAKSFGKKATREILTDVFKAIFHSALGEGNEEFWTSLGQDFSDFATGVNPDAMKGSLPRALEAGAVGAISGAVMTGPAAVRTGAKSATINKMQDEIYKAQEIIAQETEPGFTAEEVIPEAKPKIAAEEFVAGPAEVDEDTLHAYLIDVGYVPAEAEGFIEEVKQGKKETIESDDYKAFLESQKAPVKKPAAVKKPTLTENLQERLGEIEDAEAKKSYLKDALQLVEEARKQFTGRIKKYAKGQLKEELAGIPKAYVTTKEGVAPDEAMQELRDQGVDVRSETELAEYLQGLEARRAEIKDEIKSFQPQKVVKTEATRIKERLADIRRGIREGTVQTLKEVKSVQGELIDMTKMLDPKDRTKFIKTIKNIQTTQQMDKAINDLVARMAKVHEQTQKVKINEKLKKELDKTKAVRKGQRKVGKYDYQSNMFFKEARRIWKLNQAAALTELEGMPDENLSEMDLIKKRLLSLKANGAAASLEIHKQVLADIQMLKEYGEASKTDEGFDKKVARRERVDEFLAGSDKVSGGKTFFFSKLKRGYLRGVGTTHTFLNALFGKKIAEQYDTEINEAEKMTAVYEKTENVTEGAAEIYGVKNIIRMFERISKDTFEATEQTDRGNVKTLTRMQLIDIYNSIKNETSRESYEKLYGKDQLNDLMSKLDPEDMALGDMLQEEVQAYREIMNKKSIEIKGEDLGFVENYWPRSSEYIQSVFDDMRISGNTARSIKERAKGKVMPKPQNAWSVFQRSVEEAEYTDKVSNEYETLKRILNDRDIEHAVKEKFGEKVWKALHNQVDASSLHGHMNFVDAISEGMTKILNNWVKAKIFSPTVYMRQWGSASNFAENMPPGEWVKGFAKGIAPMNAKKTFDYMWNTVPYLKARYHKGYKEALTRALDDAKRMSANQDAWSRGITALVRSGDVSAIIYGGYPYIMYLQSKEGGNLSEKAAVRKFVKVALKSQQSPFPAGTSAFQRRGGATGFLSAFKNTSSQYMRKMADATIQYKNGEMSLSQYSKVMTIYGIIQPTIYVTTGYVYVMALKQLGALVRGDDEDWELEKLLDDIIVQLVVNPVNALPIFASIVKFASREMLGQKGFNIANLPMISDVETAIRKGFKKEVTFDDWVTIVGTVLEAGAAVPILTLKRIYDYIMGKKKKAVSGSTAGKTI